MKTVEISEAALARYGRKETCFLTRHGKPVAAVVPLPPGMDAETFSLSHNAAFIESFNRSWKSFTEKGGTLLEDAEREMGTAFKVGKPRTRRVARKSVARRSRPQR